MKALLSLWGPPVLGLLGSTMILISNGLMVPVACAVPPCTATGVNWPSIGMALLTGIAGFLVKGFATTGGTVANTTVTKGTLPDAMKSDAVKEVAQSK